MGDLWRDELKFCSWWSMGTVPIIRKAYFEFIWITKLEAVNSDFAQLDYCCCGREKIAEDLVVTWDWWDKTGRF